MRSGRIAACSAALCGALGLISTHHAVAATAQATSNVNLRQGPGTNYTVVTTIPLGSSVDISGCDGGWCQVSFQGQNGYVIATSVGQGGAALPPPGGAPPPGAVPPPGGDPNAPPPGYAGPPPGYEPPPGYGPPVYVAPPPYYYGGYYGPYYYGGYSGGYYGGWRGGYRRW